jgi:hypothetical protein
MSEGDRLTSEIAVTSEDPKKEEEKAKPNGDLKGKGKDESDLPDIVSYLNLFWIIKLTLYSLRRIFN